MSKLSWAEQCRDPRWQKKRLEVLQERDFVCEACEATDKTLNVHHRHYTYGRAPWEYENKEFAVLCEDCHEWLHQHLSLIRQNIEEFDVYDVVEVAGYALGMAAREYPDTKITIDNAPIAEGVAAAFRIPMCKLIEIEKKFGHTLDGWMLSGIEKPE